MAVEALDVFIFDCKREGGRGGGSSFLPFASGGLSGEGERSAGAGLLPSDLGLEDPGAETLSQGLSAEQSVD